MPDILKHILKPVFDIIFSYVDIDHRKISEKLYDYHSTDISRRKILDADDFIFNATKSINDYYKKYPWVIHLIYFNNLKKQSYFRFYFFKKQTALLYRLRWG